jgi:RNA-directed DNA polymerase
MPSQSLVRALARALLAGEQSVERVVVRGGRTLGNDWRWLRPLAQRYIKAFASRTRPRHRDVVQFLLQDRGFLQISSRYFRELPVAHWLTEPQQMQPVEAAATWDVPAIESVESLADWLRITLGDLEWFADLKGLGYKKSSQQLRHYHYWILAKQSGSIRLIEVPKPRMKEIQRQILAQILDTVPPHPAAHGFLKGRSIKTFIAPHVGQRVLLRMDLRDFFPSFAAARIQAFFRTLGYPETVADLLAGTCTNAVPRDAWSRAAFGEDPLHLWERRGEAWALYSRPHLPQGAPTSPALANLCIYRADCRLTGLARSVGAEYTRYADDLAFSGSEALEVRVERFSTHVAAILFEEGFAVNHRKTRIMRQGVRQHLAGLVANQRMNVMRPDFDRLKAMLNNCVRLGPESQNREGHPHFRSHLEGRVGFVETINPAKAKRLRTIFEQIQW